jgi:uncharacterized cysteine cluster protein YcgN (CxxCxxCC family)
MQAPFWKSKPLEEMTFEEWESLCDHCGLCCLHKIGDANADKYRSIAVSCEYLDTTTCDCLVYADRQRMKPECVKLSPIHLKSAIKWLPQTCAYRRLSEGRDLEWWHPLVCGNANLIHRAGVSVKDKCTASKYFHPEDLNLILC